MLHSPPPTEMMGVAPAREGGPLSFLANCNGLFAAQRVSLTEALTGCEVKNKYFLTNIPQGVPEVVEAEWLRNFRETNQPLVDAREQSECLERVCCPLFRGFQMDFQEPHSGQVLMSIDRPFNCDPCHLPPMLMCATQELFLKDGNGQRVAHAREEVNNCSQCCVRTYHAMDANGNVLYHLKASECGTSQGSNCCAPTCCNQTYDVDIFTPDGKLVAVSPFVWPGCNCGGLTDVSNFAIRFPQDANETQRASIVAAMFLVEYTAIALKQQQSKGGGS
uniref:Phospholipid scramblase n=1 Tax=Eutreptiella gymnastica TaxID=73025 RepID=A0A7S1NIN7_9EUGL